MEEKAVVILHEDDRSHIASLLILLMLRGSDDPDAIAYVVGELTGMLLTDNEIRIVTACLMDDELIAKVKERKR